MKPPPFLRMISPLSPHLCAHYKDIYSLQSDVQMDLISPAETPRSPASLSEKFIHKARLVFFFLNPSLLEMKVQSAGLLLGWISDIPNPGERKRPTSFSSLQERKKKNNPPIIRVWADKLAPLFSSFLSRPPFWKRTNPLEHSHNSQIFVGIILQEGKKSKGR